jgi:hypothetical protein
MSGELEDLVRDAASLDQFIGSIYKRRDEPERAHREATATLLKYIRELGENAQAFLQAFVQKVAQASGDPSLLRFERQGLTTVRNFWGTLHELVRPAEDAHTLSIPVAFVEFLQRSLSEIPGLEGCDVVISHTSMLNYFFQPRGDLRSDAQRYETIIGGPPAFPKKLALIGMPYSQATRLFLNLVICHEIGHFTFEELGLEATLSRDIDDVLRTIPDYQSMSEPDLSWCRERLRYWSEEIYCDRFAIGLIGPAYSFAYIELLDMTGTSDTDDVVEFYDTHPADACRLKEHVDQLREGNWWGLLDGNTATSFVDLMKKLAAKPETGYVFESGEKPALAHPVLDAFLTLKPKVANLVASTFREKLRRFRDSVDRDEIDLVRTYLSHGIVPSTLVRHGKASFPDGVALINAAYLFYLESLPELMRKIANQDENTLSHRSKWAERVEMWTLKALEDLSLLSYHEESSNGCSVT